MKTALFIGVTVAGAFIGLACLAAWSVQERPSSVSARLHAQEVRLSAETGAAATTRTELPAASIAADEEKVCLFGDQVRQALTSDDPAIRANVSLSSLSRWVRADAEGAALFAQGITDEPVREQVLRVVAQTWGRRDPEKAVAWAAALPDGIERRVYLGAVCIGLAGLDPATAVQWADDLGLREDGVLENLTEQWAAKDESAALDWVYRRPDGPDRDRLMQRIAFIEAQSDPARAARLVVEQIPAGPEQTEAVISVVNQWAQRNPAGAAEWVSRFPPGIIRDRALGELRSLAAMR